MHKFYYKAKEDMPGTRICEGDTVIIDTKLDPELGDVVLVSIEQNQSTALRMFTSLNPSESKILGRVAELLIFM